MKLEINGAEIGFDDVGSGPALLLIHAGIADRRMWERQVEVFSAEHRVIRFDLRGFGESSIPADDFAHHEDALALLDQLGVERAVVVGDSMGAETALDFTLTYPDRVSGLVLVATRAAVTLVSPELRRVWDEADAAYERGDVEEAIEIETRCWIDGSGRTAAEVDPEFRAFAREMIRLTWDRAEEGEQAGEQRKLTAAERIERLGEIDLPTLLVWGDRDLAEIAASMATLQGGIPGARSVVIRDTAHLPPLERPNEFNRALREFLKSL